MDGNLISHIFYIFMMGARCFTIHVKRIDLTVYDVQLFEFELPVSYDHDLVVNRVRWEEKNNKMHSNAKCEQYWCKGTSLFLWPLESVQGACAHYKRDTNNVYMVHKIENAQVWRVSQRKALQTKNFEDKIWMTKNVYHTCKFVLAYKKYTNNLLNIV